MVREKTKQRRLDSGGLFWKEKKGDMEIIG